MSDVDLRSAKAGFSRILPATNPGLVALQSLPDTVSEEDFRALYPLLVRLAGVIAGES